MNGADSKGKVTRSSCDSKAENSRDRRQTVRSPALPIGHMETLSLERTLQVWQPRASKALTYEDARQIFENVTGFFKILKEWEAAK